MTTTAPRPRRRWIIAILGVMFGAVVLVTTAGVVGVVLLVREGMINPWWTESNVAESRERGDRITDALARYHQTHSVYPQTLDEISPEYLDPIPTPTAGQDEWGYATTAGGTEFILKFSANDNDYPASWYESRHDEWFTDD